MNHDSSSQSVNDGSRGALSTLPLVDSSDRVVIVLGNGASISEMQRANPRGQLPPTDKNFLEVAEKCERAGYRELESAFNDVWRGYEPYPLKCQRMEQLFASVYLKVLQTTGRSKSGIAARRLLDTLVILLRDTLSVTTNEPEPNQHLELLRILAENTQGLSVISLNYDVLADRALRIGSAKRWWHWHHKDGYGFKPSKQPHPHRNSSIFLLKLHGSMNWYIPIPSSRRTTAYNARARIYVPNPTGRRGGAVWQRRQKVLGHSRKRIFPLLVPPVYEKGAQIHGDLATIWERAQQHLEQATLVIVWGYSLPITDYHTDVLFAQCARRARFRLIVINPDPEALARVTYVCGHTWNRWFFRVKHFFDAFKKP